MTKRFRMTCFVSSFVALGGLAACSDQGSSGDLLGPDSDGSTSVETNASGSGSGDDNRLEARLDPIIKVDASGHARSEDPAGTRDDRFDAEVEIDRDDFRRLGIDAGDGFADEIVRLTVTRQGTQVFATNLRFTGFQVQDAIFEADIRGGPAPELRAGDVGRISVNGTPTLRGAFVRR